MCVCLYVRHLRQRRVRSRAASTVARRGTKFSHTLGDISNRRSVQKRGSQGARRARGTSCKNGVFPVGSTRVKKWAKMRQMRKIERHGRAYGAISLRVCVTSACDRHRRVEKWKGFRLQCRPASGACHVQSKRRYHFKFTVWYAFTRSIPVLGTYGTCRDEINITFPGNSTVSHMHKSINIFEQYFSD